MKLGSLLTLFFRRELISAMAKLNSRLSYGVWVKEFFWIPMLCPHLVDMNAKLIL